MDRKIGIEVSSHSLAEALGLESRGPDLLISSVAPLSDLVSGCLSFSKKPLNSPLSNEATVICVDAAGVGAASTILSSNPRLDFARALAWIEGLGGFIRSDAAPVVHASARVGRNVVMGDGVRIGAHTVIHHNVVIGSGVIIGERCVIKSCAVIGEDGFGFERDEEGVPIRLVHLGGVSIGNDVEVGCFTTICRGTLSDTVVEDHVKIDDHVHIAHNVRLRRASMVIACAEISGGVDVGECAWVGPNSSIIQQLKIGRGALVGIGANVIRDVAEDTIVAGNPAKPFTR